MNSFGLSHILQNSIYNKTKRNKYSFPKSQRFPNLKSTYKIDFYDKPPPSKRSCSFGLGNKFDFQKAANKNPGPFQYSQPSSPKKKVGFSFGDSRDRVVANSYINYKSTMGIPGSKYDIQMTSSKYKTPKKCFFISKHKQDHFVQQNNNPQPGKYQTFDNITSSRSHLTKYFNSRRSIFGKATRFDHQKPDYSVGPMTYHYKQTSINKSGSAAAYEFAKAKRDTYVIQQIQKSISPGPIYYPT